MATFRAMRRFADRTLLTGCVLGVVFGVADILLTALAPLSDDTIPALLMFYGPMFAAWAALSYRASRRSGRLRDGIATGAIVAFGTFCAFYLVNMVRVNLFLPDLTARADWQNMMQRFRESGAASLRWFVNTVYLTGAPFKIGAASLIGAAMGLVGGTMSRLVDDDAHRDRPAVP